MKQQSGSGSTSKRPRAAYEYPNNAKKKEKRAAWTNDTATMLVLKEENSLVDCAWNSTQYCENALHELYYKVLNFCSTKLIDEICDILYHLSEDKVHISYVLTGLHYMDRSHQFNLLSNKINMVSVARYGCDGHMDLDGNSTSIFSTSYHLHSPVIVLDKVFVHKNHAVHDVLVSIVDHLDIYLDQCEEKMKRSSGVGTGGGRLSSKICGTGGGIGDDVGTTGGVPLRIENEVFKKNTNPLHSMMLLLQRHSMLLASIQHGRYSTESVQQDMSLVIMFEYGESFKNNVLADVCQHLHNLRFSSESGSSSNTNFTPLRILVLVVQSTASEVDLYTNPTVYASPGITVNVLPTSLKSGSGAINLAQCDPTSRVYLYDEFCKYAFNLKYTYTHVPYDLLCHINEQFHRLNHCVYTSVLQTLCYCLSMHFKNGSGAALSFFKNIEFVRKQQFSKGVTSKQAFSSESKCIKRVLDTISKSYCTNEWAFPYSPHKTRAFHPYIFDKSVNREEIVGNILNSHYKYQEINTLWLFCLKILGDFYLPERMLNEFSSMELSMSIASYRYKDSVWHCPLIDKLIDSICSTMKARCCGTSSKKHIEQLLEVLQYIYKVFLVPLRDRSKYDDNLSTVNDSGRRVFDCYNDQEYHDASQTLHGPPTSHIRSGSGSITTDSQKLDEATASVRSRGDQCHDEYCRLLLVVEDLIFEILPALYSVDRDLDRLDVNYNEYIAEYQVAVEAKANLFRLHSVDLLEEVMTEVDSWLHEMSIFMCTSTTASTTASTSSGTSSRTSISTCAEDVNSLNNGKICRQVPDALPGILDFTWDTLHACIDEGLNSNVRVKWISTFARASCNSDVTNDTSSNSEISEHSSDIALLIELLGMSLDSTRSEPPISEIFKKFCERARIWKCHLDSDSILSQNVDFVVNKYIENNNNPVDNKKTALNREQQLKKKQINALMKMKGKLEAQVFEMNKDDSTANGVSELLSCRFICCLNEIENSGCISVKSTGKKISFRKDAFCWIFDK